jgi:hypothetical protein
VIITASENTFFEVFDRLISTNDNWFALNLTSDIMSLLWMKKIKKSYKPS